MYTLAWGLSSKPPSPQRHPRACATSDRRPAASPCKQLLEKHPLPRPLYQPITSPAQRFGAAPTPASCLPPAGYLGAPPGAGGGVTAPSAARLRGGNGRGTRPTAGLAPLGREVRGGAQTAAGAARRRAEGGASARPGVDGGGEGGGGGGRKSYREGGAAPRVARREGAREELRGRALR